MSFGDVISGLITSLFWGTVVGGCMLGALLELRRWLRVRQNRRQALQDLRDVYEQPDPLEVWHSLPTVTPNHEQDWLA